MEGIEIDRIYCEDCLEGMRRIADKSVDLVVTDPPYILENQGGGIYTRQDKQYVKELQLIKDGFNLEILDECCRVLKRINIYLWCSQKQIQPYLDYFVKGKGCNWNLLSWHKTNPVPACGNKYITDTEFCLFFREPGVPLYGTVETKSTYFVTPLNTADKKTWNHPTIKPLDFFRRHVVNSTVEGDVVLDPFIGSGTTAVACVKEHRHYIGFEMNREYYERAVQRVRDENAQLSFL